MKKLAWFLTAFVIAIIAAGLAFYFKGEDKNKADNSSEYIVAVNEIEQLCASGDTEKAQERSHELRAAMQQRENEKEADIYPLVLTGICLVFLISVSAYCYAVIIRPFRKLTNFAEKIAQGDFDIPLDYERTDYFGKFTWAFDNMRREITKARACEKEAIENNKTVIASLSHDIKTPVASIRAYAEGLEAGMDTDPGKRARYIGVIIRKCDEVTKLTNDMLLHSLSDMDKLKITPECFELCSFAEKVIDDISAGKGDIRFEKPAYFIDILADKERTAQIIENLINNARKYAKTDIDVFITKNEHFAELHFRDYGKGIPDEDMPFICDKFYRGHNCNNESGSGLGLYIVRYIAVQSGGELKLRNLPDGFEAAMELPLSEKIG